MAKLLDGVAPKKHNCHKELPRPRFFQRREGRRHWQGKICQCSCGQQYVWAWDYDYWNWVAYTPGEEIRYR